MTLGRLIWDNLSELDKEDYEVVSATIVLKDYNSGKIISYGVDQYGCFYEIKAEEEDK